MVADGVETKLRFFGDRKSRDRHRRLHGHLRRGLRYGYMPDVADLAMLFVRGVPMPVSGGLHGKNAHGDNQGYRQQTYGYSLEHRRT